MTRYHIAKDGKVKPCRAKVQPCPLKGSHFDTVEEAEVYLQHKYSSIYEYPPKKEILEACEEVKLKYTPEVKNALAQEFPKIKLP